MSSIKSKTPGRRAGRAGGGIEVHSNRLNGVHDTNLTVDEQALVDGAIEYAKTAPQLEIDRKNAARARRQELNNRSIQIGLHGRESCAGCKFFSMPGALGLCRRRPPFARFPGWPVVKPSETCGEHEPSGLEAGE